MSSEKSQILEILLKTSNAKDHIFVIAHAIDKHSGSKFISSDQQQFIQDSVKKSISSLKSSHSIAECMFNVPK